MGLCGCFLEVGEGRVMGGLIPRPPRCLWPEGPRGGGGWKGAARALGWNQTEGRDGWRNKRMFYPNEVYLVPTVC